MRHKRKFTIKIGNNNFYVREIYKNTHGYFCIITQKLENAKKWIYKKNCEKNLNKLKNELDPRRKKFKTFDLNIIEVTDIRFLRNIKILKINKKNKELKKLNKIKK